MTKFSQKVLIFMAFVFAGIQAMYVYKMMRLRKKGTLPEK